MSAVSPRYQVPRAMTLSALVWIADRVRRVFLRALGPLARVVIASRERRVAALGTLGVLAALAATWFAPLALLALGPLVFGVPHLVADARYLVIRPGLHRRRAVLAAFALLVVGLGCGLGVRAGLLAAAFAALTSQARWARRGLVAAVALGLFVLAQANPFRADVVFFQAHNVVAIALWLAWRRRSGHLYVAVLVAFAAASLWLWLGPTPAASTSLAAHWTGLTIPGLGETLSFAVRPEMVTRCVLFFAFAQSVHYLIWLRLIPDEDRRGPTPRSYSQSLRVLRKELGAIGWWLALGAFAAVAVLGLVRLTLARDVYLGIAYAHGHVELLAAALLAAEGMRLRLGTS